MPFDFTGIYKLSDVNQNYVKASQIAMAPRHVKVPSPEGGTHEEWQFLTANKVNLGHTIIGDITEDTDKSVEIEDDDRHGNDGKPVLWRFEPLTLKLWNEMGEKGEIGGWEELKETINSDEAVIHFYQNDWLQPCLDWWHETPKESDSKSSANAPDASDLKSTKE